jgi:DNA-binding MarR family transcriptional regulator
MQYPFKDTVPYMITQIWTAFTEIVSRRLDEHGISIPIYRALVVLQDGNARTLSELAQIISVEQSTLSRQVGNMVRSGLITRIRPEENGRIVRIEITPQGRSVVQELTPFVQGLEGIALEAIDPAAIGELKANLQRVGHSLAAYRDAELGVTQS